MRALEEVLVVVAATSTSVYKLELQGSEPVYPFENSFLCHTSSGYDSNDWGISG
jgi:hypothetical protein